MPTTPKGIPYPSTTDKLGQLPAQMKALAEAVDAVIGADTGWVDLAYAAGYTAGTPGQLAYRVLNGRLSFRGGAQKTSGSFNAGTFENILAAPLAVNLRPGTNCHELNIGTGSRVAVTRVDTGGMLAMTTANGVATGATWAATNLAYPLG